MTPDHRPDQTAIVSEWEHNGRDCRVKWIALAPEMAYWTGYAQTTLDDTTRTYETLQQTVDVHGGITYGPRKGFVGFDCCHAGDVCVRNGERYIIGCLPFSPDATPEWHLSDVIAETESLADQLDTIEADREASYE